MGNKSKSRLTFIDHKGAKYILHDLVTTFEVMKLVKTDTYYIWASFMNKDDAQKFLKMKLEEAESGA
jgi:hypothetical protein